MATEPPHVFGLALAGGDRGDTVPVARSGVAHLAGLADPATRVAIGHLEKLWLTSELQRRRAEGGLPQDVLIRKVLVLLPPEAVSLVLINEEVEIEVKVQFRYPQAVRKEPGTILRVDEFEDICDVRLHQASADVGFLLLLCERGTGCLAFDFAPCYAGVPTDTPIAENRQNVLRNLAGALAESIYGASFKHTEAVRAVMLKDGWWPAVCLLPDTYNEMASSYEAGDAPRAAEIAASYLTKDRLSVMTAHWWSVPEFNERRCLIEQALKCYLEGSYGAGVCALVPCIEGIINQRAEASGKQPPGCGQIADRLSALASDAPSSYTLSAEFDEFRLYLKRYFWAKFRHKVAHGSKLTYGPGDCLQMIAALDSLYRRLRSPAPAGIALKPPAALA